MVLFPQDVFVPTLSQESPQQSGKKTPSSHQTPSQPLDPAPFTVPLQLSVNTESHRSAQQSSEHIDADSQATQIEDLEDASFSMNVTINYSVEETPCSLSSHTVNSQTSDVREEETDRSAMDEQGSIEEVGAVMEEPEEESIGRGGLTGMALAFSQSQLLSPEPVEEEDSVVVVTDESQVLREDVTSLLKSNDAQPVGGQESTSANGHEPDAVAATDGQMEALKDKSLSDSSGGNTGTDEIRITKRCSRKKVLRFSYFSGTWFICFAAQLQHCCFQHHAALMRLHNCVLAAGCHVQVKGGGGFEAIWL